MKTYMILVLAMFTAFPLSSAEVVESDGPPHRSNRILPAISLTDAFAVAEARYAEFKPESIPRFLESMRYVELNESNPEKGARWIATYGPTFNARGGQIFISVYMDRTTSVLRGR